ncbi:MAG: class I SAM-dependent methyltransferase [Candidatus Dormibacteraceae bacterium]
MEYERAVATAPPGWRRYSLKSLDLLAPDVRERELARIPPVERRALAAGEVEASERVTKAMFWTFVYHLEPDLWSRLASVEPVHPGVLAAIQVPRGTVVEVGAGSGRLTGHLVNAAREVVAVDLSRGLLRLLHRRLPGVRTIICAAEMLALEDGCADLTTACATVGPDPRVLEELKRITRTGGEVVLVSPEEPAWFEARGWRRMVFDPIPAPRHEPWIDEIFGPPDPPHEMVSLRVRRSGPP